MPDPLTRHNRPQTAQDYRKAIASLEASTAATESHITTTQQILDAIALTSKQSTNRPTTTGKHQALSDQISSQYETLSQYLTATSSDLQRAISSILITIDDALSRDDYTFEQITRDLAVVQADPLGVDDHVDEDDDGTNRTQKLLDALHQTETELIRTRLERVYLDALTSASTKSRSNGNGSSNGIYDDDGAFEHADPLKTSAIQSDLRTLYTEIEDVTSLFVAHEHGDALDALNEEMSHTRRVLGRQKGEVAVDKIRQMRESLAEVGERVMGLQGQRIVVSRLKALLTVMDEAPGKSSGRLEGAAGAGKKDGDGPALIGLRGYLGVGGNAAQGDRVAESFGGVKGSIERAMEVQRSQANILWKADEISQHARDQEQEEDANDISRSVYEALLDELDGEIATVKEGIEKLPSG